MDVRNINKLLRARQEDLSDIAALVGAALIYGFEYIKKAVLLMMMGGVERTWTTEHIFVVTSNILMVEAHRRQSPKS